MSLDVARLSIAVDSTDVVKAKEQVMGLADAAKAAAIAFAGWKIVQYAKDAATLAARYETLGVVMRVAGNNAGYTGAEMLKLEKGLTGAGISMIGARDALTSMATANLDLAKSALLARSAQDVAKVANLNSSEAFAGMVKGIKSGEVEILKTMGLNVQFEEGYKKTAIQLGKNATALTTQEKLQSRLNLVLQESTKYAGIYEASMETAGAQLKSMERYLEDLQVITGAVFGPALEGGVLSLNTALKDMKKWLNDNQEAASGMATTFAIASKNTVGLMTDVLMLKTSLKSIGSEFTEVEVMAGMLSAAIALLRDALNISRGIALAAWGIVGTMVSGVVIGVTNLIGLIVGFKPPAWMMKFANGAMDMASLGVKKLGFGNTRELLNPTTDPLADSAKAESKRAKDDSDEKSRILKGEQARAQAVKDAEAAAKASASAKVREAAAKALATAINNESESLTRETIKLTAGERALYYYDLQKKGFNKTTQDAFMATYDANEGIKKEIDLTKQLTDWVAESTIAIAKNNEEKTNRIEADRQRLHQEGQSLTDQMLTPGERRNAELIRTEALLKGGVIGWETYTRKVAELEFQGSTMLQSLSYGLEGMGNDAADAFGRWASGMDGAALSFSKMARQMIADMARMAAQKGFSELLGFGMNALAGMSIGGGGGSTTYNPGSGSGVGMAIPKLASSGGGNAPVSSSIVVNIAQSGAVDAKASGNMGAQAGAMLEGVVNQTIQKMMRPGGLLNQVGARS